MVDVLRAYRRWLLRRLAVLAPAFAVALLANVWIALETGVERWLKVISLSLSGISLATLGYLLSETLMCGALHRRGARGLARTLRGQLALSGGVSAACLLVLLVIMGAPFLVRQPEPAPPAPITRVRRPVVEELPPVEFTQVVQAVEEAPALAAPESAPARPEIRPLIADVPRRLEIEEKELEAPIALAPFLQEAPPPKKAVEEPTEAEALRFRPEPVPLVVPDPFASYSVDRLGQRGEGELEELPPPAARLQLLLLSMENYGRGGGADLEADIPVGARGSVVAGYLGIGFGSGHEMDEMNAQWTWHRVSVGYLQRVLGYSRHATIDFAVRAGLAVDHFQVESELDPEARVSPYVAVDAGLWQGGGWGFTVHAGWSAPVNLTGASSAVTDIAADVRLDVSERVSLFAGYRIMLVSLKDYPDKFDHEHGQAYEARLRGPLAGLEVRF